ncbi:uncharacterized protein A4U43_C08F27870 [Asparagus officinalis]|nr:uncharacterized protein A4U43_C08F27870 [Asparagus officinalis]
MSLNWVAYFLKERTSKLLRLGLVRLPFGRRVLSCVLSEAQAAIMMTKSPYWGGSLGTQKKARIWSLQKRRHQAKARLNAGEITQGEFNLEDATLASEVQAEKEAVEVLKQEASAAAAVPDAELHKRIREGVLAKHEKSISNTEAYLMSFSLL